MLTWCQKIFMMAWNFTRMTSALCSSRFGMQVNSCILSSPIQSHSCPSVWQMSSGLPMHRYCRLSLRFNAHQLLSQLRFCFHQRSGSFKMFLSVCQNVQPGFGWLRVLGPSSAPSLTLFPLCAASQTWVRLCLLSVLLCTCEVYWWSWSSRFLPFLSLSRRSSLRHKALIKWLVREPSRT